MPPRVEIIDGKKRCSRCHEWKFLSDDYFNRDSGSWYGYQPRCRDCDHAAQRSSRANHLEKQLLKGARRRAREAGLSFDLVLEDIAVPEVCPILGVPIEMSSERTYGTSPSLDRIVPELGYVRGNVQVISDKANRMKTDASADEMLAFADWAYKTYGVER